MPLGPRGKGPDVSGWSRLGVPKPFASDALQLDGAELPADY